MSIVHSPLLHGTGTPTAALGRYTQDDCHGHGEMKDQGPSLPRELMATPWPLAVPSGEASSQLARATIREQFRLCPWQLHLGATVSASRHVTGSEPQSQAPLVPGSYCTLGRSQWPLSTQSGGNTPAAHSTLLVYTPATSY